MSESEPRRSAFHDFAAVPRRAFGDKRFKRRHFAVLGAICIATDRETGCALISQARISYWANISRQYVTDIVRDLENWGYITRIHRGRGTRGKYKTLIYKVHYDAPPPARGASGGDTDHVTSVGDSTVSPPQVAESDLSSPDIQEDSDWGRSGVKSASRSFPDRVLTWTVGNQPTGRQAEQHTEGATVNETQGHHERAGATSVPRQEVAISKARIFEQGLRNSADERICDELFKTYPNNKAAALEALDLELYESAVDAEMRQQGAGVSMVVRAVMKAMKRSA
jgi:hypothetical protein